MKESISYITTLMDSIFVVFQHTVRPGSYVWKYHRPPPRRPTARRFNVSSIEDFIEMLEHLDEMDCYSPEDFDGEDVNLEELSSYQMGLLFSDLGFDDTSDSSSEEEFIL